MGGEEEGGEGVRAEVKDGKAGRGRRRSGGAWPFGRASLPACQEEKSQEESVRKRQSMFASSFYSAKRRANGRALAGGRDRCGLFPFRSVGRSFGRSVGTRERARFNQFLPSSFAVALIASQSQSALYIPSLAPLAPLDTLDRIAPGKVFVCPSVCLARPSDRQSVRARPRPAVRSFLI